MQPPRAPWPVLILSALVALVGWLLANWHWLLAVLIAAYVLLCLIASMNQPAPGGSLPPG